MATLKERKAFFSQRKEPNVMNLGGKSLKLVNIPKDARDKILNRLAEKDEVQRQGKLGILPGLKIDGKVVTKDNIHEFEIKPKGARAEVDGKKLRYDESKEEWKEEAEEVETIEDAEKYGGIHIYSKKELDNLDFEELREIGYKLNVKGRSKTGLIKDILEAQ